MKKLKKMSIVALIAVGSLSSVSFSANADPDWGFCEVFGVICDKVF